MRLPPPTSWQEFEAIVRDAQSQRWSTVFSNFGRQGQNQSGVDLTGADDLGRKVAVQCKNVAKLTFKQIEAEIKAADDGGFSDLSALYIATTAPADAKLQREVRERSDSRVADGKFAVSLMYWDEIVQLLARDPTIFRSHYPQIRLAEAEHVDKERMIAALELGYRSADLWDFIEMVHGEIGMFSQTDLEHVQTRLRTIERRCSQLLEASDLELIREAISIVKNGCRDAGLGMGVDWPNIKFHAERVTSQVTSASSLLSWTESNTLDLALMLGRIDSRCDDLPSKKIQKTVREKVEAVLPEKSLGSIGRQFAVASRETSGFGWAGKIYTLVDHEIRNRS